MPVPITVQSVKPHDVSFYQPHDVSTGYGDPSLHAYWHWAAGLPAWLLSPCLVCTGNSPTLLAQGIVVLFVRVPIFAIPALQLCAAHPAAVLYIDTTTYVLLTSCSLCWTTSPWCTATLHHWTPASSSHSGLSSAYSSSMALTGLRWPMPQLSNRWAISQSVTEL